MLDIRTLRSDPTLVRSSETRRGRDPAVVDKVLELDDAWKASAREEQTLRKTRNEVSESINAAKKSGDEKAAQAGIERMQAHVKRINEQAARTKQLLEERDALLKTIGNILHESVPTGETEDDNVELRSWGEKPAFDFEHKDHIELLESLDLVELDTAARVSGARWYYLKREAVLLDQALQRYAIDRLRAEEFELVMPPFALKREVLAGTVNLSEFEDTIYKLEDEDLYLIGTSEHALIALREGYVFHPSELPNKIVGVSSCFRKEAGSHGRDTKGIFRVHQFNKVEQIVFAKPEESYAWFEKIQRFSEELFEGLSIPYRVVNICTGDIGLKQALQYDIEAWFPGQNEKSGAYREVTSCSNCTDYQSVPLGIKYDEAGERRHVHILNNTALATSRAIPAILENHQQADGSVLMPDVLVPYLGFDRIAR
ncbi:MAG: serine--tRNA ligase [Candidatus Woesearchaeota archaeon]